MTETVAKRFIAKLLNSCIESKKTTEAQPHDPAALRFIVSSEASIAVGRAMHD